MNIWWPMVPALGCAWALPMWEALYGVKVRVRRRLGTTKLAGRGARMRPRVLPPARVALAIMALVSFAFALI